LPALAFEQEGDFLVKTGIPKPGEARRVKRGRPGRVSPVARGTAERPGSGMGRRYARRGGAVSF